MAISKITENGLTITDLTVADDLTVSDDLLLASDGAILKFGTDADVTLTHVHNTGLEINTKFDMNGQELILDADGDTSITADTDDQIDFKTAGTDRVSIDSNGFIKHFFTSDNSTTAEGLFINNRQNTTGNNASLILSNDSGGRKKAAIAHIDTGSYGAGDLVFALDGADSGAVHLTNDEKMRISNAGYVTKPSQPSISVDGNTSSAVTDSGSSSYLVTQWTTGNDSSFYSQGITYDSSNGRFTVPVAGKYLINVSIYTYQNNVFQRVQLYINGSNNLHYSFDNKTGDGDLGQDNSLGGSTIFNLSANDYIQVYMYKVSSESNKRYYFGAGHSSFSMHLLS